MVLGPLALTYNGEIYNHQQLRQRLNGPWHSTGDTETLLHLPPAAPRLSAVSQGCSRSVFGTPPRAACCWFETGSG